MSQQPSSEVRPAFQRLTQRQFYHACEMLKKHKEWFLTERSSAARGAERLSVICSFAIADSTFTDVQHATGITWQAKPKSRTGRTPARHTTRVLAATLRHVLLELNMPIPPTFQRLWEQACGGGMSAADDAPPPAES